MIPLPQSGQHEVVLHYEAPGLAWGLTITGLALVVWGAAALALMATKASSRTYSTRDIRIADLSMLSSIHPLITKLSKIVTAQQL